MEKLLFLRWDVLFYNKLTKIPLFIEQSPTKKSKNDQNTERDPAELAIEAAIAKTSKFYNSLNLTSWDLAKFVKSSIPKKYQFW